MSADRFFMDTAYVLALLNQNDKYHEQAKAILPSTRVADEVCITEAILIEIGNSLARSNRSAAVAFIESLYSTHTISFTSFSASLDKPTAPQAYALQ